MIGDDGQLAVLKSNADKGKEFYKTFFLPPSMAPLPEGPYPPPRFKFRPVTDGQVRCAIQLLKAFKAPGPDVIPNEVYRHCTDTLTPILGTLFRATFALSYYPEDWKLLLTVVLKAGKDGLHCHEGVAPDRAAQLHVQNLILVCC